MDEGRIRKIIHIDMDAFYASVEQRDEPALKGKPVAVGYPAKRGVVAAASYEARGFGVRSAMPSTVAIRKCAELVFVPPRFDVYREVSQQIHAVFRDYTRLVEPLSLDEAYLDVTDNLKGIPTAWETAKEIRARIYEETRLTASAGISYNKFLAKLASDYRKPNGQFAIMPEQGEAFVATLPVAKFHGVGPKTTAMMRALRPQRYRSSADKAQASLDQRRVERMNRTIKGATVKRYFYETHDELRAHLRAFVDVYNFARRLKTLKGLTPDEFVCKAWTSQPQRFTVSPLQKMPGLNN